MSFLIDELLVLSIQEIVNERVRFLLDQNL